MDNWPHPNINYPANLLLNYIINDQHLYNYDFFNLPFAPKHARITTQQRMRGLAHSTDELLADQPYSPTLLFIKFAVTDVFNLGWKLPISFKKNPLIKCKTLPTELSFPLSLLQPVLIYLAYIHCPPLLQELVFILTPLWTNDWGNDTQNPDEVVTKDHMDLTHLPIGLLVSSSFAAFQMELSSNPPQPLNVNTLNFHLQEYWGALPNLFDIATALAQYLAATPTAANIFTSTDRTKDDLVKESQFGSLIFDTVYSQISHIRGTLRATGKWAAAPNNAFVALYDMIVKHTASITFVAGLTDAETLLARSYNNKGNSMESLAPHLMVGKQNHLMWAMADAMHYYSSTS